MEMGEIYTSQDQDIPSHNASIQYSYLEVQNPTRALKHQPTLQSFSLSLHKSGKAEEEEGRKGYQSVVGSGQQQNKCIRGALCTAYTVGFVQLLARFLTVKTGYTRFIQNSSISVQSRTILHLKGQLLGHFWLEKRVVEAIQGVELAILVSVFAIGYTGLPVKIIQTGQHSDITGYSIPVYIYKIQ